MTRENDISRLIKRAEKIVEDTRSLVEKGWERRSRLTEAEQYLKQMQDLLEGAEGSISETCDIIRGSLVCEECNNWIIVMEFSPSDIHPYGYTIHRCKLDTEGVE